jgi:hypothetical protein
MAIKGAIAAGLVVSLVMGFCGSGAAARTGGGFRWQVPVQAIPAGNALGRISCPSASLCVALASLASWYVATSRTPTARKRWRLEPVDDNVLEDISCPSVSLCVAVDSAGNVFTTRHPASGAWHPAKVNGISSLQTVSCASNSFCVAAGTDGEAAISTNPTGGPSAWRTTTIDTVGACPPETACEGYGNGTGPVVSAISCPSVSLCVAGDLTGHVVAAHDPRSKHGPWRSVFVTPTEIVCAHQGCPSPILDIACQSTTLCLVGDGAGYVWTATHPLRGASSWRVANTVFGSTFSGMVPQLACSSRTRCLAVSDRDPRAWSTKHPARGISAQTALERYGGHPTGGPWTATRIDRFRPNGPVGPYGGINGISCPTANVCVAADSAGKVIVGLAAR